MEGKQISVSIVAGLCSTSFFRKLNLLQYYCIDVMCASGIAAALVLYMVGKTASMIFHLVSALRAQKIKYE